MTLKELSVEYRASGEACRTRFKELKEELSTAELSENEKLKLRRRITILTAMSRDAIAISNYLANYYTGGKRKCRR